MVTKEEKEKRQFEVPSDAKAIIVRMPNGELRLWAVRGHLPENYVCDAPLEKLSLEEIIDDLAENKQDKIKHHEEKERQKPKPAKEN